MYDRANPARNINELAEFLDSTKTDKHYYRGQTRYYEINAPSAIRRALTGQTEEGCWRLFDTKYWLKATARERARSDLIRRLHVAFGRALATILSQQYGISSDGYDISSDLAVAAFFATRSYPNYMHYSPSSEGDLGIIYRFSITPDQPDISTVEATLGSLKLITEYGHQIWFRNVIQVSSGIVAGLPPKGLSLTDFNFPAFCESKFPEGHSRVTLLRQTVYLRHETIESIYLAKAKEFNLLDNDEARGLAWRQSRTVAQRGGIIFPSYRHLAIAASRVSANAHGLDPTQLDAEPSLALSLGADAVFELNVNPFVEVFWFKHSKDVKVGIGSLDHLWPSSAYDGIFHVVLELARHYCRRYLEDYSVDVLDPTAGIVDRGYYDVPDS